MLWQAMPGAYDGFLICRSQVRFLSGSPTHPFEIVEFLIEQREKQYQKSLRRYGGVTGYYEGFGIERKRGRSLPAKNLGDLESQEGDLKSTFKHALRHLALRIDSRPYVFRPSKRR